MIGIQGIWSKYCEFLAYLCTEGVEITTESSIVRVSSECQNADFNRTKDITFYRR